MTDAETWTVRQHIPNFMDGFDSAETTVSGIDELLALPWVKRWSAREDFARWSHSPTDDHWHTPEHLHHGRGCAESHLMAEMQDGSFWVGAYLDALGDWSALPEWIAPSKRGPASGETP